MLYRRTMQLSTSLTGLAPGARARFLADQRSTRTFRMKGSDSEVM